MMYIKRAYVHSLKMHKFETTLYVGVVVVHIFLDCNSGWVENSKKAKVGYHI